MYVDVDSGRPDFVGVQLDRARRAERLVPLVRANLEDVGRLIVALDVTSGSEEDAVAVVQGFLQAGVSGLADRYGARH